MQNNGKRYAILNAMRKLLEETNPNSISVSDIAEKAGVGKGSIYYYFRSKEEIMEAVIEHAYSDVVEQSKLLLKNKKLDALTKMEIIFRTCRDSSSELLRQEAGSFFETQQSALFHQQLSQILIKNLRPILSDIIRQGNLEGSMNCSAPDEAADIVLTVLTIKLDNHITTDTQSQVQRTLDVFSGMLESCFRITPGALGYLWEG